MLWIDNPAIGHSELKDLVLDYNGTLALDGMLLDGVHERIGALAKVLRVHVVTADTFGQAQSQLSGLPVALHILESRKETIQKQAYVEKLGAGTTAAIGNGSNDAGMLTSAALGICILGQEGCSVKAMQGADILVRHIHDGLDLLLNPMRIKATLRE